MLIDRAFSNVKSAWTGVVHGGWGSIVAVLALAVGICASVTAGAVAYGGLLRPLPFPHDSELLAIDKYAIPTAMTSSIQLKEFPLWRDTVADTMSLAASASESVTFRDAGAPKEIDAVYITENYFDVLGVRPIAGRLLDASSSNDDAVVSAKFAATLSPGNVSGVIGRVFTVGARPLRVIGVLPTSLARFSTSEVWTLARGASALVLVGDTDSRYYRMIGRTKPGVSAAAALAAATASPALIPAAEHGILRVRGLSLRDELLGESRPTLLVFLAGAVLVLLVACGNVAMLLVNRAVARSREFAVRVALGASRGRLLVVAVLETSMLTVAGAALGGSLARVSTSMLAQQTGFQLPAFAMNTGGSVVAATTAIAALVVIVVCGAAPLVALQRSTVAAALRATTTTTSRAGRRVRAGLVVSQLAMTVVLLTGAALLGRTLLAVSSVDIGLDGIDRISTIEIPLRESSTTADARNATVNRVLEEARQLPGVTAAGIGAGLPPNRGALAFMIRVTNDADVDATHMFDMVPATDGYFEALGMRLVEGRLFQPSDTLADQQVCVLSEAAVKHMGLIRKTVIGKTFGVPVPTASGKRVAPRVVGIVKDVHYDGMDNDARGGVYVPWRQLPYASAFLVVRSRAPVATITSSLMRIVRDADPSMPLNTAMSFQSVIDTTLLPRTARFSLVGVFAVGAALLGIIGLSGALIRSVVERHRELAIRAAVGATPRRLLGDVMKHGLLLTGTGVIVGIAASAALARTVSSLMFGVSPRDPLTYALTSGAVLLIALVACVAPALRASKANPLTLLRAE